MYRGGLRSGRRLVLALLEGWVVRIGEESAGIDLRAHFCICVVPCGTQGHKAVTIRVGIAS